MYVHDRNVRSTCTVHDSNVRSTCTVHDSNVRSTYMYLHIISLLANCGELKVWWRKQWQINRNSLHTFTPTYVHALFTYARCTDMH